MKLRLGEEPPVVAKKKKKNITKLDDFAKIYFKEKEIEVKDIEKIKKIKRKVLAERTVNALIQIIGAIYNVAIQKEIFKGNNPVNKSAKRVNVDNKRERYYIF